MIGVIVQPAEQAAAREFFELCKTPWEFYRDKGTYRVLLSTREALPPSSAALRLIFSTAIVATDAAKSTSPRTGAMICHADHRFPLYGAVRTFPSGTINFAREESTQEPILLAHRESDVTVIRVGYNLFDEIHHLLTQGQPVHHAGVPTLEMHLDLLRDLITRAGLPLVEIPPAPSGYPFITCLTHDIDHPVLKNHCCDHTMFGFLYRATLGSFLSACRGHIPMRRLGKNWLAAAQLPLVYLGLARDFWQSFDQYIEIEAGRPSTYFVIPEQGNPGRRPDGHSTPKRASRYEITEIAPQLERLIAAGDEVGLHGLDAWRDTDAGRREQARLSKTIGAAGTGVRMHWLYFDQNSPRVLDEAGFSYDSTVGYNETVGYRAGTTQVYRPWGVEQLLELPLHVMDTALFYPDYLNLTEKAAHQLVSRIIHETERFGGVLTFNWHDRSIAPERLWGVFYRELLEELQSRKSWFATAAETVAWFRQRRSATVEIITSNTSTVTLRGRLTTLDNTLPGLRVRVHKPHKLFTDEALATGPAIGFVETLLTDMAEISLAL